MTIRGLGLKSINADADGVSIRLSARGVEIVMRVSDQNLQNLQMVLRPGQTFELTLRENSPADTGLRLVERRGDVQAITVIRPTRPPW